MEGKVSVDRTESGGKAFHIELTQKIAQKRRSDSRQTEPAGGERRKVLVFEKSREDYEVLEKAIIDCGGEVHQVGSVRDFIREQKNGGWDYLFIDHDKYMGIREELDSIPEKGRLVVLTDIAGSNIGECPGIMLIRPAYYTNISALFSKRIHPSLRRSALAVRAAFKGIRAMAVDDNMTNLSVLCALLKKYDLEVYTASGGMECLNRLRNQEVDIIFMDYMMPGMDGIDTLKCIREMDEEWAKKVPVVAVTANAVAGIREKLLGEGFDDYLTKPVEINRLENCIGRFFGERQK
jgi:CheY-like chemotaxis protein